MTSATRAPRERLVEPGQIERHVADMTVTFSADVPLAELQNSLAEVGQWAPIDGPGKMPIGRLIEINSTGPLRLGFGAWRDLLLGVQFTNGRGELISAGGRTVKNVAGYDLTKFMVGQCRMFGTIETATMRTYRKPAGAIVATFAPEPAIVAKLLTTALRPQWAALRADRLLLGYLGDEPTLQYIASELLAAEPSDVKRMDDDESVRGEAWPIPEIGMLMRISLPPSRVGQLAMTLTGRNWSADPVFGIVIVPDITAGDIDNRTALAEEIGGSVRVFANLGDAPGLVRISTNEGERQIIQQLKQAFDPENQLQPLVF